MSMIKKYQTQGTYKLQSAQLYMTIIYSKVRRGGPEKIPLVQGKEQQLHVAGAAMKRYPTSKITETQVSRQVLQEGIRGQTD